MALLALLTLLVGWATPAFGQSTAACLPDDEGATESLEYLKKVLNSTSDEMPALRDSIGIASYPDTALALIQDDAVCQQAVLAFERDVADSVVTGRQVYVFRISDQLFVVEDPEERAGEWSIFAFYTPSWIHHRNLFW